MNVINYSTDMAAQKKLVQSLNKKKDGIKVCVIFSSKKRRNTLQKKKIESID